eukprot:341652_1
MYDDIGKLIEDLTYKYVTPIQDEFQDTHEVIVDAVIDVLGGSARILVHQGYGETLSGQITCGGIINAYGKPFEVDGDLNVTLYNNKIHSLNYEYQLKLEKENKKHIIQFGGLISNIYNYTMKHEIDYGNINEARK